MKTNLIKKIGTSLMLPALALSLLLFSPRLLSNVDTRDANVVAQDTTLQDSPIIIVGKVIDLDHQPLEGVVIRDNNKTIEILTDGEGKFELNFDTATVVSFTKMGFYNVEHKIIKSDSNLVVILTPESNQLIVKGYDSPAEMSDKTEWFDADIDTTSTLKQKYDLLKDSIDSKSMEKDSHMDMNMNDSLKEVKKDMWNKDMKHDMDTTKTHKHLHHHERDSTNKLNSNMIEKK